MGFGNLDRLKINIDGMQEDMVNAITTAFANSKKCILPSYISSMHIPLSADAEFSCECDINARVLRQMAGLDKMPGSVSNVTIQFSRPYEIQARRHKKKRINKKWAKRYGYITKFKDVKIDRVDIESIEGGFELRGPGINELGR